MWACVCVGVLPVFWCVRSFVCLGLFCVLVGVLTCCRVTVLKCYHVHGFTRHVRLFVFVLLSVHVS